MRVFWDTNLFVYLLEPHGPLTQATVALIQRMSQRGDLLYTSTVTLGELIVQARLRSDEGEVARLRHLLRQRARVVPFDDGAADHYASIRAFSAVRGPDAFQLACAAAARCDLFVTNDDRLSRRIVPGVPVLASLSGVPI